MEKDSNFSEWYNKIVRDADIIDDRYPIKGMPVYKTYGFRLVLNILRILEKLLEKNNIFPVWFPVLIPETIFKKESEHIRGFEKEVFWITRGGFTELEEKYILRPTSETEMYYMFKYWITSYADLPLLTYMTNTVYRYETKATKPLIRGREIIWNEAHTVHATKDDAERMIKKSIEIYSTLFWDYAAVPHVWIKRPEWDKFAGADYTLAADTILPDGRRLQIGTTHLLGQNFAKAFDIQFMDKHPYQQVSNNTFILKDKENYEIVGEFKVDLNNNKITYKLKDKSGEYKFIDDIDNISEENEKLISIFDKILEENGFSREDFSLYKYVWQTSFGVSMRFAAAVISIHGDNKGLILPSKIAPIQIVIVPIYYKDEDREKVLQFAKNIYESLKDEYRVYLDDDDSKTPGWKFNYWEFKGVPLRIEIGPKDISKNSVTIAIRTPDSKAEKVQVEVSKLTEEIEKILMNYDNRLKDRARKYFESKIVRVKTYNDLRKVINDKKVAKAPFCMREECADMIKNELSAEVWGYEFKNPENAEGEKCVYCGNDAKYWVYISRSY